MIIFMDKKYYSIENFVKVNVISESSSGRVWVHMYTKYINPILLINETEKNSVLTEDLESSINYRVVRVYTSPQRAFDIGRGLEDYVDSYQFMFSPITGKFILEDDLLKTYPDSYYEFWFKNVAFSRRYIAEDQIKEIWKYSLYNIGWQQERYIFGRLERLQRENIKFKFKFFNREKMKDVFEFCKGYIPFAKDMCQFFLKKEDNILEEVSI